MKPADLDLTCFPKRIKKLKNVLKTVVCTDCAFTRSYDNYVQSDMREKIIKL